MSASSNCSQILRCLIMTVALSLWACAVTANSPDPKSKASFYLETYGQVDASTEPLVATAKSVFQRVLQVADRKASRYPGLHVVNSDGQPWAIALPDGHIILSRGALKVCFDGVSEKEGEARLAFILGHELAHLSSNDFWHREVYLSLSGETDQKSIVNLRQTIGEAAANLVRQRELAADDVGFLYATMAGFDTAKILGDGEGRDFFAHWIKQTRGINQNSGEKSSNAIEVDQRTDFLRARFSELSSRAEIFSFGVRLAHFGRHRDAIDFFRDFQRSFPSREVFNNLGFSHLQLARQGMPSRLSQRYWLPMELDHTTRLTVQTRSLNDGRALSDASRRELEKAVEFLRLATQADIAHIPSRLNLVAAYMYLDEFHKARAVIEEARKISPDDVDVLGLRALVIYEQEREMDMFPIATSILGDLAQQPQSPGHVLFNLARLLEGRGKIEQAEKLWNALAERAGVIPSSWLGVVCKSVPAAPNCSDSKRPVPAKKPGVRVDIAPGDSIDARPVRDALTGFNHVTANLGPIAADIFSSDGGSVLALGQTVEVLVTRDSGIERVDQLNDCCGRPLATTTTAMGDIWTFPNGWAAIVEDGLVKELWMVAD